MKQIYSAAQHEAMALAAERMTAQRVVDLAASGRLELNGERLPAFETTRSTVSSVKVRRRRRRAGEAKSELATVPARDAVEELRRRYIAAADHEFRLVEALQRSGERVNLEQLRQLGRVMLELSRLPGPGDPPPPSPDTRGPNGKKIRGRTRGGLTAEAGVGPLLAAHRQDPGRDAGDSGAITSEETQDPTDSTGGPQDGREPVPPRRPQRTPPSRDRDDDLSKLPREDLDGEAWPPSQRGGRP